MLLPDKFEGDINMSHDEVKALLSPKTKSKSFFRNALRNRQFLWDNGIVPYELREDQFSEHMLDVIREAMQKYHDKTCIK